MTSRLLKRVIEVTRAIPELKLTGSYYFGGATEMSDVDFYAKQCLYIQTKLTELGFECLEVDSDKFHDIVGYTADFNCAEVWQDTVTYQIHIQLVKDELLKTKAQEFLANLPLSFRHAFQVASSRDGNKRLRSEIWRWAFTQVFQTASREFAEQIADFLKAKAEAKGRE